MNLATSCIATIGLLGFPLFDHSGQDARLFGQRARYEMTAGRFEAALGFYRAGFRQAEVAGIEDLRFRYLNNIGGCQLALFQYNEASRTLFRLRDLAKTSGNGEVLASVDGNLAALFQQTGDLTTAESYARESLDAYSRAGKPEQRAQALMILADILSRHHLTPEAEQLYGAAIKVAVNLKAESAVYAGWLHFGKALFESGRIDEADSAFAQSWQALKKSPAGTSGEDALMWNLARLRLRQNDLTPALSMINRAIEASPKAGMHLPAWRLYATRAEIKLRTGNARAALEDAREALKWAHILRANIVPDNNNRVGIEGVLDDTISVLIEAGNRVYLQTGDPKLARETFEAAEESRAESLEAMLPDAGNWRARLATPEYRYKLSQLLREQQLLMRNDSRTGRERLARVQTELSQIEADSGVPFPANSGSVLDRVRRNLPADSALLSFRLGDRASWLWSVDHGRLSVYALPPKTELLGKAEEFVAAVLTDNRQQILRVGRRLYRDLFGRGRSFETTRSWFLSVDEPLYTLPLSALVVDGRGRGPVYLAQRTTLQIVPGAQLLQAPDRSRFGKRKFVLAGDGIYNRADPRYDKAGFMHTASWEMARLPGSGVEVRFAADLWRSASVLTGARLTKEALLREIDKDPDVIHIATHVVQGQDHWHSGMLALGLDPAGEPDLLTAREIELHPVHSRLVLMSGCSSAAGATLPASGLMGLTRAWLAAGAGEVLATRWPARDESADGLIGAFYRHLLSATDGNVPEALRRSRLDMIARGGWRAEPRYWSGFLLIGVR